MTTQWEYRSASHSQDVQQLGAIIQQCFGSSPDDWERYLNWIGAENFRLLSQSDRD
jgi:hypothetical protein